MLFQNFCLFILIKFVASQNGCDYSNCPEPDPHKLNIHMVPHTHDDVGWVKTVDEYYRDNVQYILDSVVKELSKSRDRKFIYVETAFFWKWWNHQSETTKAKVKELVNSGQLEFINGGWCMNDEATAHYNSIIDQMTWGFRRLEDIFGKCGIPKIGWQLDPFGHSREQASLFAQMNFDAVFFSRNDYADHQNRENHKTMELIWNGNDDLGKSSNIFTNIIAKWLYNPPPEFCWFRNCINDFNINSKTNEFIRSARDLSHIYATNNVMFAMGGDFTYEDAGAVYDNMDKLMHNIKSKHNNDINIFYSTPSCYLNAVHQSNHTFQVKTDDFFPYGSDPQSFWVGYFTSRPTSKFYERVSNNFLQICKQLDSLALLKGTDERISKLREAMGVMQHHDAISGTEKQHVANDYHRQLSEGTVACESVIQSAYEKLLKRDAHIQTPELHFCHLLNVSACDVTAKDKSFVSVIYNPIGRAINSHIRLPVNGAAFHVTDSNGKEINSEVTTIPEYVLEIPERKSNAKHELNFKVNVPPLGFSTYFIKEVQSHDSITNDIVLNDKITVNGNGFNVHFDSNGAIDSIDLNGQSISLRQTIGYYRSSYGHGRPSGAYVFRPNGQTPINLGGSVKSHITKTATMTEVRQKYNDWTSQTIRVYNDERFIEFDWVIGPIPVNDGIGKEIILKFDSDLITNKIFYTDANGRQMMKRVRDHRETWNYTVTEPVAGNYYPINSRIAIRDEHKGVQLTLLSDRSQGGSSIKDGSMEIMVHRRCIHDDGFGVEEPLNEPGTDGRGLIVRGKHYLIPSKISDAANLHRDLAERIFMGPMIALTNTMNHDEYRKNFATSYSGLNTPLPLNVHLLTLEQWRIGTYLLRLEHFYESRDDSNLSKSATVDLENLFKPFIITDVSETTLGANQLIGLRKRIEFKTSVHIKDVELHPIKSKNFTVILNPMQIRTFVVTVKESH